MPEPLMVEVEYMANMEIGLKRLTFYNPVLGAIVGINGGNGTV